MRGMFCKKSFSFGSVLVERFFADLSCVLGSVITLRPSLPMQDKYVHTTVTLDPYLGSTTSDLGSLQSTRRNLTGIDMV